MKNMIKNLLVMSAPLFLFAANATAESCGGRLGPCPVPEPGTPYLFIGAIGVAIAVAKFRKKK